MTFSLRLLALLIATISMVAENSYAQTACPNPITQNKSSDLTIGGIACASASTGVSYANSYARSFNLGQLFPNENYQISCITFGITNSGSSLSGILNLYADLNGGAPIGPGVDLSLLVTRAYTHFNTTSSLVTVNFSPPICIAANTVLVAEISIPESTNGYASFQGNTAAETSPTYIRTADCGLNTYVPLTTIGDFQQKLYMLIGGAIGCGSAACDCSVGNDCSVPHNYPGCEDSICEQIVCAADPLCCSQNWDTACANLANSQCGTESFPCDYPNLPCIHQEAEVCGTETNDGCNMSSPSFETIPVNSTLCGSFYRDGLTNIRDTDWYSFELTERSIVTLSVYSRVAPTVLLMNNECGDDLAIFASNDDATCPAIATACLDPGTYTAFIAPQITGGLPCSSTEYSEYFATLFVETTEECPGFESCPDSETEITANVETEVNLAGISCDSGGITSANYFARSYDFSTGETAGTSVEINCVEFGAFNDANQVPAKIGIWIDENGGAPSSIGGDLSLVAEVDTSIIGFNTSAQRVVFDPPVCIPPDEVVVITLYIEASTTGYASFAGNITGSTSPTYIYSFGDCGISGFVDLAQIGFPDRNWVQIVHANITCEGDEDNCLGDYNLDGTVDGVDFGAQLAAWGECDECPQDLDGDGLVNGNDVGLFLAAWGPCSQP